MTIRATTRLFLLLGDPVHHSLSPAMQNAGFADAGLDAVYVALPCGAEDVPALMHAAARAGGGGNITLPHKRWAAATVTTATEVVRATGACNTFWLEHGQLHGDNTDVAGMTAAVERLTGTLTGVRALVLGAGGGASAAVYALLSRGAGQVLVLGRSRPAVDALVEQVRFRGRSAIAIHDTQRIRGEALDLVVNATPLGLQPDDPPATDLDQLGPVRAVFDMAYAAGGTALTRAAAARGIAAIDGTEMLLAQGAASFECWFRQPAPVAAMRAALEAQLQPPHR